MKPVAALFCRRDSVYKTLPGVDVWDAERDAMNWPGGMPAVCHPPCAQWGFMAGLAEKNPAEKWLALLAVAWIRMFGGVLEHPRNSRLRKAAGLPAPGDFDDWGGWTLVVSQRCWGHAAEKPTLIYVAGCRPSSVPPMPISMTPPTAVVTSYKTIAEGRALPVLSRKKREATPIRFAEWLVELARRCDVTGGPK